MPKMPKCSKCQKEAVARLEYCGLDLCEQCFSELFEKRVWKANRDYSMLRRGDKIAVAVSGGKDSAAMLHVLNKMAKKIGGGIKLLPIIVDEGIAGYRPAAMAKARELCESEGMELSVTSFREQFGGALDEMMKKRGAKKACGESFGACSLCGVFRKKSLNAEAIALGADSLAVGHNADDIAQTFLMNLMRKDSSRLVRFAPKSAGNDGGLVRRIKPLLYNLERECALYCLINQLPFHLQDCPYASESFRGTVKDFLNSAEEKHAGIKFNLLQSFLMLQKSREAFAIAAASASPATAAASGKCPVCGCASSGGKCKACEYSEKLGLSREIF